MGRMIYGQVIASTGLDRHGEEIPAEDLKKLFEQLKAKGLPPAVSHDLTATPIVRSSNPRLTKLESGNLAIVVDLEVLNEEAFSTMRGFSIAYTRRTVRFGHQVPSIAVLLNPLQFDFDAAVSAIAEATPRMYGIDVTERIEKSAEWAVAIIAVILTVASQMALRLVDNFMDSAGSNSIVNSSQIAVPELVTVLILENARTRSFLRGDFVADPHPTS